MRGSLARIEESTRTVLATFVTDTPKGGVKKGRTRTTKEIVENGRAT